MTKAEFKKEYVGVIATMQEEYIYDLDCLVCKFLREVEE